MRSAGIRDGEADMEVELGCSAKLALERLNAAYRNVMLAADTSWFRWCLVRQREIIAGAVCQGICLYCGTALKLTCDAPVCASCSASVAENPLDLDSDGSSWTTVLQRLDSRLVDMKPATIERFVHRIPGMLCVWCGVEVPSLLAGTLLEAGCKPLVCNEECHAHVFDAGFFDFQVVGDFLWSLGVDVLFENCKCGTNQYDWDSGDTEMRCVDCGTVREYQKVGAVSDCEGKLLHRQYRLDWMYNDFGGYYRP